MAQAPVALITGGSSGIGEAFARSLAARKYDLVLVARSKDRLLRLSTDLSTTHGVEVRAVATDLSKPSGVDQVLEVSEGLGRDVDLLVNNAGIGSYGPFAELPLNSELEMVDLNVRALVALTGLLLPKMIARRSGAILQIASTTSFQAVPFMATYAATKAFVLSFTEALARETQGTGVRLVAVCPGHTPTRFQKASGVDRRPARTWSQQPSEVVREALQALESPAVHMVVTGLPNKITTQVPRFIPRKLLSWGVARAFRPRDWPGHRSGP